MRVPEFVLDPKGLSSQERKEIADLDRIVRSGGACLVGPNGERRPIPEMIHHLLSAVLDGIAARQAMILVPTGQELSTQQAARHLGVSRQHFVDVLERGEIEFHQVGTHRRVYLRDLLEYQKNRDRARRAALNDMVKHAEAAGVYDKFVPPEDDE